MLRMREPGGSPHDDEGAGGHYISSGAALVGLGTFGLVTALVSTLILKIDGQVIDGGAMALTSVGFTTIGAWMISQGRALQRACRAGH